MLAEVGQLGYHGGIALGRWFPELADGILIAVTEKRTKAEIDGLAEAYAKALASMTKGDFGWRRSRSFIVLAGPNGSGKSTAASALLHSSVTFVNADEIARGLPGYPSRPVDLEAGRLALARMDRLAEIRADFAFETTLASRSLASRVTRLKSAGYFFQLIFLCAPNADFSVQRVASRVSAGGHDVPEETIRRRYRAGLVNFCELYRPLADRWDRLR